MSDLHELLSAHKAQLVSAPRVLVGFSGGLDSSVLLRAVSELLGPSHILAIHVNHQISPDADLWEHHCKAIAEAMGIAFYSETIGIRSDSAVEETARNLRYQIFTEQLGCNEILLLGHHASDQSETLLFRLFRGSGTKGLAAIPEERALGKGMLLRPLLSYSKQSLQEIAEAQGIEWIEDPSNEESEFDRNFLRNRVLPLIKERWPSVEKQLFFASAVLREADDTLAEVADEDIQACGMRREAVGISIDLKPFIALSALRKKNLLRRFIYNYQGSQPDQKALSILESEVLGAASDAQPKLSFGRIDVRRFKGRLYLTPAFPDTEPPDIRLMDWPAEQRSFELPGVWRLERKSGPLEPLQISFRQGGERIKPVGRNHSQTLKKLLLDYNVEPWLRDWLPVINCRDEIVAVGDRIQCSNFEFHMQWSIEDASSFR